MVYKYTGGTYGQIYTLESENPNANDSIWCPITYKTENINE